MEQQFIPNRTHVPSHVFRIRDFAETAIIPPSAVFLDQGHIIFRPEKEILPEEYQPGDQEIFTFRSETSQMMVRTYPWG